MLEGLENIPLRQGGKMSLDFKKNIFYLFIYNNFSEEIIRYKQTTEECVFFMG